MPCTCFRHEEKIVDVLGNTRTDIRLNHCPECIENDEPIKIRGFVLAKAKYGISVHMDEDSPAYEENCAAMIRAGYYHQTQVGNFIHTFVTFSYAEVMKHLYKLIE